MKMLAKENSCLCLHRGTLGLAVKLPIKLERILFED